MIVHACMSCVWYILLVPHRCLLSARCLLYVCLLSSSLGPPLSSRSHRSRGVRAPRCEEASSPTPHARLHMRPTSCVCRGSGCCESLHRSLNRRPPDGAKASSLRGESNSSKDLRSERTRSSRRCAAVSTAGLTRSPCAAKRAGTCACTATTPASAPCPSQSPVRSFTPGVCPTDRCCSKTHVHCPLVARTASPNSRAVLQS